MSKRRVFDIDFPDEAPGVRSPSVPAGTETRRGPMAAAISENADALRERQLAETSIREENDRLAHELVRLKKLGLIVDLVPLDAIRCSKLTRDRSSERDPELDELKESIRSVGLSNPIRVEQSEAGEYELIQGFRRLAAYRELLSETGDERFATIPAGLLARGETLDTLYRRMVDENMVRRDISFAEMATLAQAYMADPQTEATDVDQAISTLFGSAGRQKRVYIRNFVSLLDRMGDNLAYPHAMPRALGLALLKLTEKDEGAAVALQRHLGSRPDRSEEEELAILRSFAERGGEAAASHKLATSRSLTKARAKTTLRVVHDGEVVRCLATDGRVELRLERDCSAVDRRRLEQAVQAFIGALEG